MERPTLGLVGLLGLLVAVSCVSTVYAKINLDHDGSTLQADDGLIGRLDDLCQLKRLTMKGQDLCSFFAFVRGDKQAIFKMSPNAPVTIVGNIQRVCSEHPVPPDRQKTVSEMCEYFALITKG